MRRRLRLRSWRTLGIAVALLLPAAHLPAQTIRGRVTDRTSGGAIPGAVIVALDSTGRALARGASDQRGVFLLPPTPGARRLRVLRLGFRPLEQPLDVAGAALELRLDAVPLLLEPVRVNAAASCPRRADRAQALALLEQVRAGLLATVVARAQRPAHMTLLLFERRPARDGERIASQTVQTSVSSAASRSFAAARDARAFVERGFLDAEAGVFLAPDAETLIDDQFAKGYCFHLMPPDRRRPELVGLGFRAARRAAGRVDVDGALWVDSVARALDHLAFRYVGLEPVFTAHRPGGHIGFRELANGVPLIDRWWLRLVGGRVPESRTGG
ncbi:MAG TPA: carboxypeptidase-like regulatory domain-containing protein, partial [Gemmatimonadaceae bacterium]|nr:carboxypeptidase-like regulatory domain-containing protein [Gemmatimonadaceae bacterium]